MKKKKLLLLLVALALLVLGGWYIYQHYFASSKPAAAPGSSYVPGEKNPPVAASSVTIENYAFSPAHIKVKKGTTVTWTNKDFVGYTVTEDDGQKGPESKVIKKDQTYTYKFDAVGLFHYHDSLDPNVNGTVTVTE